MASNLDYVTGRLPSDVEVYGLFDAGVGPRLDTVDDEALRAAPEARNDWEASQERIKDFADESCVSANADDPGVCLDLTYVRLNHTTTP